MIVLLLSSLLHKYTLFVTIVKYTHTHTSSYFTQNSTEMKNHSHMMKGAGLS